MDYLANKRWRRWQALIILVGMILGVGATASAQKKQQRRKKPGRFIRVVSSPQGATVYLDNMDGRPIGKTPIKRVRIEYGYHELFFVKEGYKTEKLEENIDRYSRFVKAELVEVCTLDISAGNTLATAALLSVDGKPAGPLPQQLQIEPGRHQVEVKKEATQGFSQWVECDAGKVVSLPVLLVEEAKEVGTLFITSDVPGAPVFVDGINKGQSPLSLDVEPGPVVVEVRAPGFTPWQQTIEVRANEKTIVQAQVRPESGPAGTLMVLSNVSGTTVFVDGQELGLAPATAKDLVPGTHIVEAKSEGYAPSQTTAQIVAGEQTVIKVELQAAEAGVGEINVRSSVPGALVYVDGGEQGPAPVSIPQAALGPHAVVVRAVGFEDYTATCEVKMNQQCNVMASLRALTQVRVTSNAKNGRLFVNGKEMGPVPMQLTLPTGDHLFEIESKGYNSAEQRVTLQASADIRELNIFLESDGPSPDELEANASAAAESERRKEVARLAGHKGASSYSGVPIAPGFNTFEVSAGIPYLVDVRATVGLHHLVDVGVGIRYFVRGAAFDETNPEAAHGLGEIYLRARSGFRPAKAFSIGGYLEAWGGTDFSQTSSFGFTLGAQPTLHFGERATFAIGLHYDGTYDNWRRKPNLSSGNPEGDQFSSRLRVSGDLVFWVKRNFGIFAGLQYKAAGPDRRLYQDLLFGAFKTDTLLYGHLGLTFGFGK